MKNAFDRYGLVVNNRVVKTPIAIASMSGIVDAHYVLERADHTGMAFIGGYSVDPPAIEASRSISAAGERKEFVFDDPVAEIKKQVELLSGSTVVPGINIRAGTPSAFVTVAQAIGDSVVYEIDAHCRQAEMIAAGCGEYYLQNQGPLVEAVKALKHCGVTVSVKIRAGVAGDDRKLARKLWAAGADILHIDLMDFGSAKLRQIRNACPLLIIANNSITSFDRMKEMFSHGADLVSVARRSDPATLAALDEAIAEYADTEGWYNAPKQLCRGGDVRSLTFCCMPVKECPLIPTLSRLGIEKEAYIRAKIESVRGTPLEGGTQTCFGSLSWCCKTSSPCMFRDLTLKQIGLSRKEYMRLKRDLSETMMCRVFHDVPSDECS